MALPLPLFIGLRYVRARSRQFFVSFITWVSMLGICIGVATLITIISIMNGFENELRNRLLSVTSHATLTDNPGALTHWRDLVARADQVSGVTGAAPYIEAQVLLSHEPDMSGAVLRGIDPAVETAVSDVERAMIAGDLSELQPGSDRIVLGRVLAYQLGANVGDHVTVLIPQSGAEGDIRPRIRRFTVSGIFEVGVQDNDGVLALAHLQDVGDFLGRPGAITGLRLRFDDVFAAPQLAATTAQALGGGFRVSDWTRENASYFRAIRIEKTMMLLIMLLIVAVAAFNIVATLVMVVTDKRTDIAILRTLGLKPRAVVGVFLTQGVVIGWLGTALGVAAGLALAFNVETVAPWLEHTFHFQFMDADVYYISQIPSDVQHRDVILIAIAAFLLTLLATLYPALRAARTEPAEALRYE
jgi:lipoprotein-releasing system permease protein